MTAVTDTPDGSVSMGHAASGFVGPGASGASGASGTNQTTSAIVLCDTALTNSKLARLCQRGALLLPVANRPIIQYILDTLARSGIGKVTFAGTDEVSCDAISMYLTSAEGARAQQNVSVSVVCDPSCGKSSVNLIRRVMGSDLHAPHDFAAPQQKCHVDEDVLVVGSLFVSPSDVSLQGQLLYHKVKNAAVTMVLSEAMEDDVGEYPTTEYVAVRSDGAVAAYCPAGTSKAGDVKVPAVALLGKSAGSAPLRVHKDVLDLRIYIFNKEALSQVLRENEGLLDVQRHLIPYFVRRTVARSGRGRMGGMGMNPNGEPSQIPLVMERMSSSNLSGSGGEADRDRVTGLTEVEDDWLRRRTSVLAYMSGGNGLAPGKMAEGMVIVNSEASYANANRDILKNLDRSDIANGVVMGAKVAVGNGSIIGTDSSLGDKASVKRSVVGPNCTIGANTKIINCIIHEGVRLGDGCHVQNSILCRGATLEAKCVLKDCVVGPNSSISGAHKSDEFFEDKAF